jgi:hypothetical protein
MPLDGHVHHVLVSRHQLVPHLHHLLEGEIGFLQIDHDVLQIDIALPGGEILRHLLGGLLRCIYLIDRRLEGQTEIGAFGILRSGSGLTLRHRAGSAQFGEHLFEVAGVDSHALFIANRVPEI